MNFLVCISKTPETTAKIAFVENNTKFDENGVQFIMNPYDEWYALVRAIELKEQHVGEVCVINVGDASNDSVIRKALAIGADRAIRIDASEMNASFTARNIAQVAKDGNFDIVMTGKETIDYNGSLVGSMIAAHLDVPYVSYANALDIEGSKLKVSREIEGGVELLELAAPCVISAAKGMAEQRIPNMRGIMMAKRKPLEVKESTGDLAGVKITQYELPNTKQGVTMIDPDNMDELVRRLKEEAKVL